MKAILGIVLLASSALAGCGASPDEHMAQARQAYSAHHFADARNELIAALGQRPSDPVALDMLVRSQLELGDGDGAAATLDKLAGLNKAPVDAAILRGDAELLKGNPKQALAAVDGQDNAEAWRIRALAALRQADADAAAGAFARGAKAAGPNARLLAESARFALLRGDHAAAHALLAKASGGGATLEGQLASAELASSDGRVSDALSAYERASASWPESRAALIGRAAALGDLGRTEAMEPLLSELARRAPDDFAVTYLQARLAAAKGDWVGARQRLQPVEARLNEIPQARLLYGQALARLNQPQQAESQIKAFLARDPGNRIGQRLLGQAKLAAGDSPGAVEVLRPLASRGDALPEEVVLMGAAATSAKRSDAGAWQAKARAAATRGLGSRLAIADAAMKRQDWRRAAAAYRDLLAVTDGRNAMLLNNLAYAESKLGNGREALAVAQKALAAAPNNASVLDTAGWIMINGGADRDQGLALLRKAARLAPANRAISEHLAAASKATLTAG